MDVPGFLRDQFGGLRCAYLHRWDTWKKFHESTVIQKLIFRPWIVLLLVVEGQWKKLEWERGRWVLYLYLYIRKKKERIKPTQIWHKRHKKNPEKKIIWQVKHGIWMMVDRNHQNNGLFLWKNDWDLMEEVGIVQPQALFLICFKKTLILSVNLLCKFFFFFFLCICI